MIQLSRHSCTLLWLFGRSVGLFLRICRALLRMYRALLQGSFVKTSQETFKCNLLRLLRICRPLSADVYGSFADSEGFLLDLLASFVDVQGSFADEQIMGGESYAIFTYVYLYMFIIHYIYIHIYIYMYTPKMRDIALWPSTNGFIADF